MKQGALGQILHLCALGIFLPSLSIRLLILIIDRFSKSREHYQLGNDQMGYWYFAVGGLPLVIPFSLNYILNLIDWYRNEDKRLGTVIFPLLNIYPQFCKFQGVMNSILKFI